MHAAPAHAKMPLAVHVHAILLLVRCTALVVPGQQMQSGKECIDSSLGNAAHHISAHDITHMCHAAHNLRGSVR